MTVISHVLMTLKLISQLLFSNRYLVHTGDALSYLYLVCNGSMEVLQNDMVVAILGKGDLVGCDIPFTLIPDALIKSSSDVKALTYCDLKSIHVPGLLEVLKLYPEFAETFCTEIIHDLTFNLREGSHLTADGHNGFEHDNSGLPSISEDDEDDDDDDKKKKSSKGSKSSKSDDDNDDEDDDHNSSPSDPPSSPPSTGGAAVAVGVSSGGHVSGHKETGVRSSGLSNIRRRISAARGEAIPLLPASSSISSSVASGGIRRPALRFMSGSQSMASRNSTNSSNDGTLRPDLKEEVEATRSSIDRLDSQVTQMRTDIVKLSEDFRVALSLLQRLCLLKETSTRAAIIPTTTAVSSISSTVVSTTMANIPSTTSTPVKMTSDTGKSVSCQDIVNLDTISGSSSSTNQSPTISGSSVASAEFRLHHRKGFGGIKQNGRTTSGPIQLQQQHQHHNIRENDIESARQDCPHYVVDMLSLINSDQSPKLFGNK